MSMTEGRPEALTEETIQLIPDILNHGLSLLRLSRF